MDYIIITSIFQPTVAVKKFAHSNPGRVIVVGDKKTPADWLCDGVDFLDVNSQLAEFRELADILPYNHYCRKNIGYARAIRNGATGIVDTDDDNIPNDDWGFPVELDEARYIESQGFTNIYKYFSKEKIWPRGLPLSLINNSEKVPETKIEDPKVGVWQGLADGDPDVDAVYRLVLDRHVTFEKNGPIVLSKGNVTPFNSQNTWMAKEFFPLLYLPSTVTFRYTDILRGIVAQPILWSKDSHLGFTDATVFQERNPHDYFRDFESEVPMYLTTEKAFDIAISQSSKEKSVSDSIFDIYSVLYNEKIVEKNELEILEVFLKTIS